MARRKEVVRREPEPDWKYNSVLVSKFINGLMRKGKKSVAERVFYQALDLIEERTSEERCPCSRRRSRSSAPSCTSNPAV